MSLRRVWHLFDLPWSHTLVRLISIARYAFDSLSIGFRAEGQSLKYSANSLLTCILYQLFTEVEVNFSNSLIIHKVNYKSPHVYHITCMCLDTQWKTLYHSSVKVVYTTKICTMTTCTKSMNIYYSLLLLFSKSHPFALLPAFLHPKHAEMSQT